MKGRNPEETVDVFGDIEIAEIVNNADEGTVRAFLTRALRNDEDLADQFKFMLNPKVSRKDMTRYKNKIDDLIYQYGDRHGFIDYDHANEFCWSLSKYLSDYVRGMIDNGEYISAFDLAGYVFVTAAGAEMDDSSGCLGVLAHECEEYWEEIYQNCSNKDRDFIFNWCEKNLDGSVIDYMEEYIESFYFEHFQEKEYLEKKLRFIDQKIDDLSDSGVAGSWSRDYQLQKWLMQKISLMETYGTDSAEFENLVEEYWHLPSIRKWKAEQCLKNGDVESAIHILRESISIDNGSPGLVRDYALKLKDIYKETGKHEEYVDMLWQLETNYLKADVDIWKELKSVYSGDEWLEIRESLLEKLSGEYYIHRLYCEENMYDKLLEICLRSHSLSLINTYQDRLTGIYPEEVLKKYVDTVNEMASRTGNRKLYQELVRILNRIRKMPGGDAAVADIVNSWRQKYKNRPAMMDELCRLQK